MSALVVANICITVTGPKLPVTVAIAKPGTFNFIYIDGVKLWLLHKRPNRTFTYGFCASRLRNVVSKLQHNLHPAESLADRVGAYSFNVRSTGRIEQNIIRHYCLFGEFPLCTLVSLSQTAETSREASGGFGKKRRETELLLIFFFTINSTLLYLFIGERSALNFYIF